LTPAGDEAFKDNEMLKANFNPAYDPAKTYWYKWYKGTDLNATTLIDTNLVAYYPFNGNTNDYWGTNNGTPTGSPTQVTGKVGGAYQFDGLDDYVTLTDIDLPTAGTISAWINVKNFSATGEILEKRNAQNNDYYVNYEFTINTAGKLSFWISKSTTNGLYCQVAGVNNYSPNTFYHVVATFNSTSCMIYGNGILDASTTTISGSIYTNNSPAIIGLRDSSGEDSHFNGTIDEVMVFNRALSSGEVQQLYYGGLYDGNKMGADRTTVGEQWKAGYRWNSAGGQANWSADANSPAVTIAS
jgi:hypothetical protein